MFKILVPLIAVASIALFIIFKSVFLTPKTTTSPVQKTQNQNLSNKPLTQPPTSTSPLPITSPSPSPSFPPTSVTTVNDSRIRTIETAIIDLRSQVAALKESGLFTPSPSSTTTTTSSSKAPLYIPVGAGEASMQGANWTTIPGYEITIDTGNYSGYKNMQLEASIRLNQSGGTIQARLINFTDSSPISYSDFSVTGTSYTMGSSGTFTLPSGSKTYKLQLNPTDGTTSFVQSARIKVNF